jgi:hypothetical protein
MKLRRTFEEIGSRAILSYSVFDKIGAENVTQAQYLAVASVTEDSILNNLFAHLSRPDRFNAMIFQATPGVADQRA